MDDLPKSDRPTWLELERVKPLSEASDRTSLSEDTIKRNYPDYVVQLSARRVGMKEKHIRGIANGELRSTN